MEMINNGAYPITRNYNNPSMSEDVTQLAAGMLVAQDSFVIKKLSGMNSHTKKKYATLRDIYKAIKTALKKENIWVEHHASKSDTGMDYIHTRLTHSKTGQFLEDCRMIESEKPGNQGKGSANTYCKRYALLALCAIEIDEDEDDDDGVAEAERIAKGFISKAQYDELDKMLTECPNEKEIYEGILRINKIKYLDELKAEKFEDVKIVIQKYRK
jgi:hypothetical protein